MFNRVLSDDYRGLFYDRDEAKTAAAGAMKDVHFEHNAELDRNTWSPLRDAPLEH